jgi:hypothetical protein
VRFSWKVVEPQGQREHDVRVSRLGHFPLENPQL